MDKGLVELIEGRKLKKHKSKVTFKGEKFFDMDICYNSKNIAVDLFPLVWHYKLVDEIDALTTREKNKFMVQEGSGFPLDKTYWIKLEDLKILGKINPKLEEDLLRTIRPIKTIANEL